MHVTNFCHLVIMGIEDLIRLVELNGLAIFSLDLLIFAKNCLGVLKNGSKTLIKTLFKF